MQVKALRPHDPRRLGQYDLLAVIGQGGMGTVYQAIDASGRIVAVKVVKAEYAAEHEFRARFRSEVARARQVPSHCTAAVLDADPDHETPYLVVEFIDGPDLTSVVRTGGPLTGGTLHNLALGVATALVAIHGAGVVHRDLKPGNVLFALGSPRVIDFGIARALEAATEHTRSGEMMGTLSYMAPEQLDGTPSSALTPAVDVFAWGALVAYAASGHSPFPGHTPAVSAVRILTGEPDLDALTGPLRGIVERALSKNPAGRPTARALIDMLLATDSGLAPVPPPPDPVPPVRPSTRPLARHMIIMPGVAVAVAVASVGTLAAVARPWEAAQPAPAAAPPAGPAPVALTLLDQGDKVVLRWDGAATSGFEPLILGGRDQQQLRPMGQVAPGVDTHTVAGLNPDIDYCFAVGPDTTGPFTAVCTERP